MNLDGCSAGWATDQMFMYNNTAGTCDLSVALFVTVTIPLMIAKVVLAVLHVRAWQRRQRKLYAKMDRRKHYPIVPTLSVLGALVYCLFFPLAYANVINTQNGWSYGILSLGWLWFGIMSLFFLFKIVRLGRRLIPIIQEKRRNEMLEQMQRDEDDPPTYNSAARPRNGLGALASNPMYEDDPPTYDENSSSQAPPEHTTNQHTNIFPHHRQLFGQGMVNGRIMFENKVATGKRLLGRQVQNSKYMFSKRPAPTAAKGVTAKKAAVDPPKNPMWEEDPPTTYSILEIVEPSLDRLKKLDVLGKAFFLNAVVVLVAQFIIFFIMLTFVHPGTFSLAQIAFGFQATFLFQHAISMNYQFQRVINAVRESRRKSRRNENIEIGLSKLRNQQATIFIMASICGIFYILMASAAVPSNWYWNILVMYFEVGANAVIYGTFSSKLRGKINELKKQQRAQKNLASPGAASPQAGTPTGQAPNSPRDKKEKGLPAQSVGPGEEDGNAEKQQRVFKSSVAHVRESAKFATTGDSERKEGRDEKPSESVAPSF